MNEPHEHRREGAVLPRLWRLLTLTAAMLILCSCKAPTTGGFHLPNQGLTLPPEATGGAAHEAFDASHAAIAANAAAADCHPPATPLPIAAIGPWAPPGIAKPWPHDEYVCDGGDRAVGVKVDHDWQIHGLESEDTIAHYDTLEGETIVEPSNRVCVYAPRFGAVRSVVSASASLQVDASRGVEAPDRVATQQEIQGSWTALQSLEAVGQRGVATADTYQLDVGDGGLSSSVAAYAFQDAFLPFEDLTIIREGRVIGAEAASLARGVAAAIVWTHDQAVQVILDRQAATAVTGDARAQATYTIDEPEPRPKLRLVKVASTDTAQVGEEIHFTLRFDNIGNQTIGNVTIVDHLTSRLEYVPDSAQASVEGHFLPQQSGATLVLRFEATEPLEPGDGGVIRFRCRVR